MCAYPEPDDSFRLLDAQGPVVDTHAHRPELFPLADLLEAQRRVLRGSLEQLVGLVRQLPYVFGELLVVPPKERQANGS